MESRWYDKDPITGEPLDPKDDLIDAVFRCHSDIVDLGIAGRIVLTVRKGASMDDIWRTIRSTMEKQGVEFVQSDFIVEERASDWTFTYDG